MNRIYNNDLRTQPMVSFAITREIFTVVKYYNCYFITII